MSTLRLILDICLLRGKPQDLPASMTLVLLTGLASVIVDLSGLPGDGLGLGHVAFMLTEVALFGAVVWAVLRLRGFAARWMQTVTALYAANALFSLLLLPLLPALADILRQGPGAAPGWQAYVSLALSGWFLAVMARVLREATEWSLALSLLVSIVAVVFVQLLGLALAPLFGLNAAA